MESTRWERPSSAPEDECKAAQGSTKNPKEIPSCRHRTENSHSWRTQPLQRHRLSPDVLVPPPQLVWCGRIVSVSLGEPSSTMAATPAAPCWVSPLPTGPCSGGLSMDVGFSLPKLKDFLKFCQNLSSLNRWDWLEHCVGSSWNVTNMP